MEIAYVLHHVRADDEHGGDAKLIGVYRSEESAQTAVHRLSDQAGFRDYPGGFEISPYPLDKDHWVEGFGDPA
jgi:homoserine kinase type II